MTQWHYTIFVNELTTIFKTNRKDHLPFKYYWQKMFHWSLSSEIFIGNKCDPVCTKNFSSLTPVYFMTHGSPPSELFNLLSVNLQAMELLKCLYILHIHQEIFGSTFKSVMSNKIKSCLLSLYNFFMNKVWLVSNGRPRGVSILDFCFKYVGYFD